MIYSFNKEIETQIDTADKLDEQRQDIFDPEFNTNWSINN